jgi:imidazolonepropionase
LRRTDIGSLTPGSRGDLVVLNTDQWVDLAYRPGADLIGEVACAGVVTELSSGGRLRSSGV